MTAEFTLAVHALVYLGHRGCLVPSKELAENICTNPARVRKVMTRLHKAELAESQMGKGSGYQAIENYRAVTLDRILAALGEEPIAMHWRSGDMDRECMISSGMGAVMADVYSGLNQNCIQWLSGITIGEIEDRILSSDITSYSCCK